MMTDNRVTLKERIALSADYSAEERNFLLTAVNTLLAQHEIVHAPDAVVGLATALCEWDMPNMTCRCAALAADDIHRCASPIGIARSLLRRFTIVPRAPTPAEAPPAEIKS
jgi:hypothetical protein